MELKKYTVIWNDVWQTGSHWHTSTKCQRLSANSIQDVMHSIYGKYAQYIFEGWPRMVDEKEENGFCLPVIELHTSILDTGK